MADCFFSASRPIGYLKLQLISHLTEQYTDMMSLLTVLLLDSACVPPPGLTHIRTDDSHSLIRILLIPAGRL